MVLTEQNGPAAIRAENLVKRYENGVTGLNGISLSIYKGEMVGILGKSGSGKTTFFRLLNGSITPTEGNLSVFGQNIRGISHKALRRLRAGIAAVYQHHNIIPGLSVARNVLMGRLGQMSFLQVARMVFHLKDRELGEVYRMLEQLGIEEKIFDRATDLSGGQQQRVAIARALLSGPRLILADEPIASVDHGTAEVVLNLFRELNRERQITVILNLHQEDFALQYCSRVVVLEQGSVIYNGSPEQWDAGRRGRCAD